MNAVPHVVPGGGNDPAGLAPIALNSLARDGVVEAVLLLRLAEFLWHELPTRWIGRTDHHLAIATALAGAFARAAMQPHAAMCGSPLTRQIILIYGACGSEAGFTAYRQALAESGLEPPDTPVLRWSHQRGPRELDAHQLCASDIEQAITSGTLTVGAAEWQSARAEIMAHRLADGWLDAVHAERRHLWAQAVTGRQATLRRKVSLLIAQPVPPPDGGYPALRWLLSGAASGLPLSADGQLDPRVVATGVDRFSWRAELPGVLSREADVLPLLHLRRMSTTDMRAVTREGDRLVLTPTGRDLLADADLLHDAACIAVIGGDAGLPDLDSAVREAALATLLTNGPLDHETLIDSLLPVAAELGGQLGGSGIRLDEAVRRAVSDLLHRLWALGVAEGALGWTGPVELGPAGERVARTALRSKAIAPRDAGPA